MVLLRVVHDDIVDAVDTDPDEVLDKFMLPSSGRRYLSAPSSRSFHQVCIITRPCGSGSANQRAAGPSRSIHPVDTGFISRNVI